MSEELHRLRERIDALDRQLVELLNARAAVSRRIGELKGHSGRPVLDEAREQQVLRRVAAANTGPLSTEMVLEIYRAILSTSRVLQRPIRVAYLGPAATFTHQAARRKFGGSAQYLPAASIGEVFLMSEKGEADYGVVPVENSTEGVVSHTLDMFMASEQKISAEVSLRIAHYLMSKTPLEGIRRVYSHPQALAQCRRWLGEHLPKVEVVEVTSTARAAEIARDEPGAGAVAPELAAEVYGLNILASHIEDMPTNTTRFLVIGQSMSAATGRDRTALMFCLQDRVGALHDALAVLKRQNINLSMIESRPSRTQLWDWVFFTELEGHPDDAAVAPALEALRRECSFVKVLGAWPAEPAS